MVQIFMIDEEGREGEGRNGGKNWTYSDEDHWIRYRGSSSMNVGIREDRVLVREEDGGTVEEDGGCL